MEAEADGHALELMRQDGYNPRGALVSLQLFRDLEARDGQARVFPTHPTVTTIPRRIYRRTETKCPPGQAGWTSGHSEPGRKKGAQHIGYSPSPGTLVVGGSGHLTVEQVVVQSVAFAQQDRS